MINVELICFLCRIVDFYGKITGNPAKLKARINIRMKPNPYQYA